LVVEEESVEMSSYELSISSDSKKKKKKKKKKAHKNSSAVEDEFYELPAAPFRPKLTDDEMAQAVKKMLREGNAYWDAGDVVSCTMVYLKFMTIQTTHF